MANVYLNKESDLATSNVESKRQQFSIADMSIIINLLTKLYSNPIQTLTQEYISNGRDANREVGSKQPIDITIPTVLSPTMRIRDYGPGLTPERIEKTFLYYGASTKRKDNGQVGGFGIGAKSAWSYTDSFNIITFVDGIKRTYVAHKSGGNGNLDLISQESTTEPNGTEIVIGVANNDCHYFRAAVIRAVRYWEKTERPNIKNLTKEELGAIFKTPIYSHSNLEIYESNVTAIVVDGIPYSNKGFTPEISTIVRKGFVLHIPNGKVNIAPNREELIDDDTTKKFLAELDKQLHKSVTSEIQNKINATKNSKEGFKEVLERKKLFNFNLKYKNYRFDHWGISIVDPNNVLLELGHKYDYWKGKLRKKPRAGFNLNDIDKIYYDDMPKEPWTKKTWRIRKLLKTNSEVFLLNNSLDKSIIDDLQPKNLSDIDASDYSVNRTITPQGVVKKDLCVHFYGGNRLDRRQVDLTAVTNKVVYALLESDAYTKRFEQATVDWVQVIKENKLSFGFIAGSVENQIVNDKNFIKFEDFIKNYVPSDNEVRNHIRSKLKNPNVYNYLKNVRDDIKSKGLQFLMEINEKGNYQKFPSESNMVNNSIYKEFKKYEQLDKDIPDKFPLLNAIDLYNPIRKDNKAKEDLVKYINSKK